MFKQVVLFVCSIAFSYNNYNLVTEPDEVNAFSLICYLEKPFAVVEGKLYSERNCNNFFSANAKIDCLMISARITELSN